MYFLFYILVVILILIIVLLQFFNIITEKTEHSYQKYINLLIFTILISTIIGVIINLISVYKTHNKVGIIGLTGIEGKQGNHGKNGVCNSKCGQKICYIDVVDHANKILNNIVNPKIVNGKCNKNIIKIQIKNKAFLKKLKKICSSDEYYSFLTKQHKKQPTEIKLINYIKDIIENWIHLIIYKNTLNKKNPYKVDESNEGIHFLKSKNRKLDELKNYNYGEGNIYNEIYKYDIFRWGEQMRLKRKKLIIKSDTLKHPSPDEAELNIIKSNNYKPVYNANSKIDEWNADKCPYNQMGIDKSNPNNLNECIYINENDYTKSYKKTWKETEYKNPQELSLYNVSSFKNNNGQHFYPVGSVWRGKNSDVRPPNSLNYPESNTLCGDGHGTSKNEKHSNKGPEKETILISGNIKSPTSYEKIWDSKQKCPECQTTHTQIFRPIPPKGYKCLGDVSIQWFNDKTSSGKKLQLEALENMNIKCVPTKCVRKLKLGNKVWDNKNFRYDKYNSYINYTSKVSNKSNKQLSVSFWDGGNSNSGEEIKNNYGVDLEENGGYNLFRAGQGYSNKPKLNTYIIKQECLMPGKGKIPKKLSFNITDKKEAGTEERYDTSKYFGKKPQLAILTNINNKLNSNENLLNNFNDPKKFYLVDDSKKRNDKNPDTFYIKTYNPETNDFSSCLYYNSNNEIIIKPICNKNSLYNKWVVKIDNSSKKTDEVSKNTNSNIFKSANISIHPNHETFRKYSLKSYYDMYGKAVNTLEENDLYDWKYETPIAEELPKGI